MYTYYKKVKSDKHYLYANEIAEYLYTKYGIVTLSGRPAIKMVEAVLADKEADQERLFYMTRKGLRLVHPAGRQLMELPIEAWISGKKEGDYYIASANGRNWKYRVLKEGCTANEQQETYRQSEAVQ